MTRHRTDRAAHPDRSDHTGLFARLLDDAAVFPPGNVPLAEAVHAHREHHAATYADLLGPLVVAAHDLGALGAEVAGLPPRSLRVSVTAPLASVCRAVAATDAIAAIELGAVEVVAPPDRAAEMIVAQLTTLLADRPATAYLEVPRDERRDAVIAALAGTPIRAKLRTGGVMAELHPAPEELAEALVALARAGVPFKATAGLHHAVRNTDPVTGFDQHGFLNLMLAADAAAHGHRAGAVAALLAERDAERVATLARGLTTAVRSHFLSFGTCSIADPVEELVTLGLLPSTMRPCETVR